MSLDMLVLHRDAFNAEQAGRLSPPMGYILFFDGDGLGMCVFSEYTNVVQLTCTMIEKSHMINARLHPSFHTMWPLLESPLFMATGGKCTNKTE